MTLVRLQPANMLASALGSSGTRDTRLDGDLAARFDEAHAAVTARRSAGAMGFYDLPYDRACLHEVVLSASNLKRDYGVRAMDVAKRLIDYGIHPPTMYFPLIVDEALMIEPTETESKETLDAFVDVMTAIAEESGQTPGLLTDAPHNTPVGRLDEARAARQPDLRYRA